MTLLCNENLNSFLTRVRKLFKGGNYSREEIIRGNTVLGFTNDKKFTEIVKSQLRCNQFWTLMNIKNRNPNSEYNAAQARSEGHYLHVFSDSNGCVIPPSSGKYFAENSFLPGLLEDMKIN